ncbi:DUF998 domain-containing protein [Cuniculiplasma sp. SKW3]|uniref:DUF998 domain-containing protein n=1 Tax=unclassified Cuniculiplasma TaxID=2619706 RepID=UPI003FD45677
MNKTSRMDKMWERIPLILGVLAIMSAWITIGVAIWLNPWFKITSNALSDLGGGNLKNNGHPSPTYPFVYNYGLIVTGILIGAFSISMIREIKNKIEIVGFSFFIIGGLFLALIGIYHEGTYPHDFVSSMKKVQ